MMLFTGKPYCLMIESESGTTPDFDRGLTTESMFVAADDLGPDTRIYGFAPYF
jgi:hypothetical protein